ncbi:MAG: hypothetical protein JWN48_4236 [Myxococcaceae bacterium]|nr:hypothetical protein [Myxococcaceae bacterium]
MDRFGMGVLLSLGLAAACGDDSSACDSSSAACGDEPSGTSVKSLLGASPASYTEINEVGNNQAAMAELTAYTLEGENGLAIHGTFEATAPSTDTYRFNSGTFGTLSTPGFPGIDIQLVVDGKVVHDNTPLLLSLDTVVEHGFSSLSGGTYFTNAALLRKEDYVIKVAPSAAGKSYTLELRAHAATTP